MKKTNFLIIGFLLFLFLSACQPRLYERDPLPPPDTTFRLSSGDSLTVRFRFLQDLDESQVIRPDGKISMQLIGEVRAAGLTPMELEDLLENKYKDHLIDPIVTVVVRNVANQFVYIAGSILVPSALPYVGNMTVMQAVMAAGGFNRRSAELSNVLVIRHVNGKRYATSIDLQEGFESLISDPVYLANNDIIYVPQKRITEINTWLDQHIHRIIGGLNHDGEGNWGYSGIASTNTSLSSSDDEQQGR